MVSGGMSRQFLAMRTHDMKDLTIIGGGPTGIVGLFCAGARGATAQLVDALPELGRQLTALYPETYIAASGDGRVNVFTFHERDAVHGDTRIRASTLPATSPRIRASSSSWRPASLKRRSR